MIRKIMLNVCVGLGLLFLSLSGVEADSPGREEIRPDLSRFDRWVMPETGAETVMHKGQSALHLKSGKGERIAYLRDVSFDDGVIELKIAAVPSYTGLVFRVRGDHVYEGIYFRPQNSRHADPVRRGHTVQYHAGPRWTWHHLRETDPARYEASADLEPEEWFRVRLEVEGSRLRVFVNGAADPCLTVEDLKHGASRGSVGLWAGNGSGGTFADLSIRPVPPRAGVEYAAPAAYTPGQKQIFELFKTRRSVRKFRPDPVPQEHLIKILDMARTAPTSGNQQPWKFLVVQDKQKIERLLQECVETSLARLRKRPNFDPSQEEQQRARYRERFGNYLSAPVYVVVLTDKNSRYPGYNVKDGSLAAGYLVLAARALGYGTVFITDALPFPLIKKVFAIPDNYHFVCITPIGVPEAWPDPPDKLPLREIAVFENLIEGVNYTVPVKRKAVSLPAEDLEDYVGRYRLTAGPAVTITLEEGRIFTQIEGQPKLEIFAEARDEFFLKAVDAQVSFVRGAGGEAIRLVIRQGGRDIPAERIKNPG